MTKVFVTGGLGYIGSVVCEELLRNSFEVVIFDNLSSGHLQAQCPETTLITGDLCDPATLEAAFQAHEPEAVFHFAARSIVSESIRSPDRYYQTNLYGSLNLLNAMRKTGCDKLVFSSTAAVYGQAQAMPLTEASPLKAVHPYGHSKLAVEQILEDYRVAYGLRYASLRYFNAAGASDLHGEDHRPETHLIPLILEVARGERPVLEIYGTDYDTPDGTAVRDYIHVIDLALAHLQAYEYLNDGSGVFNLGNGRGFSVWEVVQTAQETLGIALPVSKASRREGDPPCLVASSEKAQQVLGWQPRHGDLAQMIASAKAWQEHYPEGYND